jgi:outer membrane receptor protein involved in Fe transport
VEASAGLQARGDAIANGLHRTAATERLATVRGDAIDQLSAGPYAQARVRWTPWLRTVTGLRADLFRAGVESTLAENSGDESDLLLSPKVSAVLGPWHDTEVYLNWGHGFHSNDARGTTIRVDPATGERAEPVAPLVRARSADLGVRTRLLPGLEAALTAFALELDSELVFVGDAGATEASRPSRRTGVELQSFWRPRPWLSLDADVALSRGRFTDDDPAGDRIPGSIERAAAMGVAVEGLGPISAALRLRHFGPRPLVEDGSVRSTASTLVNGRLAYAFPGGLQVALDAFNLLDRGASDIEYFYASRLPGEPSPVEDVHFHPAEPRSFRLAVEWRR